LHYQATTLDKLTPMCLCLVCHQAVQFDTGQRAVMLCRREGNRRSGVVVYPPTGSWPPRGRWAARLRSKLEHGPLYLFYC